MLPKLDIFKKINFLFSTSGDYGNGSYDEKDNQSLTNNEITNINNIENTIDNKEQILSQPSSDSLDFKEQIGDSVDNKQNIEGLSQPNLIKDKSDYITESVDSTQDISINSGGIKNTFEENKKLANSDLELQPKLQEKKQIEESSLSQFKEKIKEEETSITSIQNNQPKTEKKVKKGLTQKILASNKISFKNLQNIWAKTHSFKTKITKIGDTLKVNTTNDDGNTTKVEVDANQLANFIDEVSGVGQSFGLKTVSEGIKSRDFFEKNNINSDKQLAFIKSVISLAESPQNIDGSKFNHNSKEYSNGANHILYEICKKLGREGNLNELELIEKVIKIGAEVFGLDRDIFDSNKILVNLLLDRYKNSIFYKNLNKKAKEKEKTSDSLILTTEERLKKIREKEKLKKEEEKKKKEEEEKKKKEEEEKKKKEEGQKSEQSRSIFDLTPSTKVKDYTDKTLKEEKEKYLEEKKQQIKEGIDLRVKEEDKRLLKSIQEKIEYLDKEFAKDEIEYKSKIDKDEQQFYENLKKIEQNKLDSSKLKGLVSPEFSSQKDKKEELFEFQTEEEKEIGKYIKTDEEEGINEEEMNLIATVIEKVAIFFSRERKLRFSLGQKNEKKFGSIRACLDYLLEIDEYIIFNEDFRKNTDWNKFCHKIENIIRKTRSDIIDNLNRIINLSRKKQDKNITDENDEKILEQYETSLKEQYSNITDDKYLQQKPDNIDKISDNKYSWQPKNRKKGKEKNIESQQKINSKIAISSNKKDIKNEKLQEGEVEIKNNKINKEDKKIIKKVIEEKDLDTKLQPIEYEEDIVGVGEDLRRDIEIENEEQNQEETEEKVYKEKEKKDEQVKTKLQESDVLGEELKPNIFEAKNKILPKGEFDQEIWQEQEILDTKLQPIEYEEDIVGVGEDLRRDVEVKTRDNNIDQNIINNLANSARKPNYKKQIDDTELNLETPENQENVYIVYPQKTNVNNQEENFDTDAKNYQKVNTQSNSFNYQDKFENQQNQQYKEEKSKIEEYFNQKKETNEEHFSHQDFFEENQENIQKGSGKLQLQEQKEESESEKFEDYYVEKVLDEKERSHRKNQNEEIDQEEVKENVEEENTSKKQDNYEKLEETKDDLSEENWQDSVSQKEKELNKDLKEENISSGTGSILNPTEYDFEDDDNYLNEQTQKEIETYKTVIDSGALADTPYLLPQDLTEEAKEYIQKAELERQKEQLRNENAIQRESNRGAGLGDYTDEELANIEKFNKMQENGEYPEEMGESSPLRIASNKILSVKDLDENDWQNSMDANESMQNLASGQYFDSQLSEDTNKTNNLLQEGNKNLKTSEDYLDLAKQISRKEAKKNALNQFVGGISDKMNKAKAKIKAEIKKRALQMLAGSAGPIATFLIIILLAVVTLVTVIVAICFILEKGDWRAKLLANMVIPQELKSMCDKIMAPFRSGANCPAGYVKWVKDENGNWVQSGGSGSSDSGVGVENVPCLAVSRNGIFAIPELRALARAVGQYENNGKYTGYGGTNNIYWGRYKYSQNIWSATNSHFNLGQSIVNQTMPEQQDKGFISFMSTNNISWFGGYNNENVINELKSGQIKSVLDRNCLQWNAMCKNSIGGGKQDQVISLYTKLLSEEQSGNCGNSANNFYPNNTNNPQIPQTLANNQNFNLTNYIQEKNWLDEVVKIGGVEVEAANKYDWITDGFNALVFKNSQGKNITFDGGSGGVDMQIAIPGSGKAEGTPILAPYNGEVISQYNRSSGTGNGIRVYYPSKDITVEIYHLQSQASNLSVGSSVSAGSLIGFQGKTGSTRGIDNLPNDTKSGFTHMSIQIFRGKVVSGGNFIENTSGGKQVYLDFLNDFLDTQEANKDDLKSGKYDNLKGISTSSSTSSSGEVLCCPPGVSPTGSSTTNTSSGLILTSTSNGNVVEVDGDPKKSTEFVNALSMTTLSPLKELIITGESAANRDNALNIVGGGPSTFQNIFGKPASQTTINELAKKQVVPKVNGAVNAAGWLQIIGATRIKAMDGLEIPESTYFNTQTQDTFFKWLIFYKRPEVGLYLLGKTDNVNEAAQGLAREWASIGIAYPESPAAQLRASGITPTADQQKNRNRGQSLYDGVNGNSASISPDTAINVLKQIRATFDSNPTVRDELFKKYESSLSNSTSIKSTVLTNPELATNAEQFNKDNQNNTILEDYGEDYEQNESYKLALSNSDIQVFAEENDLEEINLNNDINVFTKGSNIPIEKIQELEKLILEGKLTIPNDSNGMESVKKGRVNIATVNVIIESAKQLDNLEIWSLWRPPDAYKLHSEGVAIDVRYITIDGKKYDHYKAYQGDKDSVDAFVKFAKILKSTGGVRRIITNGVIMNTLKNMEGFNSKPPGSPSNIRVTTAGYGSPTASHQDHFHIDMVEDASVNDSNFSSGTGSSCCIPSGSSSNTNSNESSDSGVGANGIDCLFVSRSGETADPYKRAWARAVGETETEGQSDPYNVGDSSGSWWGRYQWSLVSQSAYDKAKDLLSKKGITIPDRNEALTKAKANQFKTVFKEADQDLGFILVWDDYIKSIGGMDSTTFFDNLKNENFSAVDSALNKMTGQWGVLGGKRQKIINFYKSAVKEEKEGKCGSSSSSGTISSTNQDLANIVKNKNLASISVQELNGSKLWNSNGDTKNQTMSTIKVPIVAMVIRQVQAGKLNLNDKVKSFNGNDYIVREAINIGLGAGSGGIGNSYYLNAGNDLAYTVAYSEDNKVTTANAFSKFNNMLKTAGYNNTTFGGQGSQLGKGGSTSSTTNDITKATNYIYIGSGNGYDTAKNAMKNSNDYFKTGQEAGKYGLGDSNNYPSNTGIYSINGKKYVITVFGKSNTSTTNITNSYTEIKNLIKNNKISLEENNLPYNLTLKEEVNFNNKEETEQNPLALAYQDYNPETENNLYNNILDNISKNDLKTNLDNLSKGTTKVSDFITTNYQKIIQNLNNDVNVEAYTEDKSQYYNQNNSAFQSRGDKNFNQAPTYFILHVPYSNNIDAVDKQFNEGITQTGTNADSGYTPYLMKTNGDVRLIYDSKKYIAEGTKDTATNPSNAARIWQIKEDGTTGNLLYSGSGTPVDKVSVQVEMMGMYGSDATVDQARSAGRLIAKHGIMPDKVLTHYAVQPGDRSLDNPFIAKDGTVDSRLIALVNEARKVNSSWKTGKYADMSDEELAKMITKINLLQAKANGDTSITEEILNKLDVDIIISNGNSNSTNNSNYTACSGSAANTDLLADYNGGFIYPYKTKVTLTSRYGMRGGRMHKGIDLSSSGGVGPGNDIIASALV